MARTWPNPPAGTRESVPLAPWTTLGIGGPARWFLETGSPAQVEEGLSWAAERRLPLFVLGGGSNLLIADEGFPGLVLRIALRGIRHEPWNGAVMLEAAAGEDWDPIVEQAVSRGLAGVECLSGIPGSAGATPIQNVGAYGQEVSETIAAVEALARDGSGARRFDAADCGFGYRDSVFKREERDRWVILRVAYRLQPGGAPAVRYGELAKRLEEEGGEPDLARVRRSVLALRRAKGMVLDPDDPDTRSDGSFFMNPVIPAAALDAFLERVAAQGIDPATAPRFPARDRGVSPDGGNRDGGVKLAAGWLIERAGFRKGHRHGGVGISTKHALAIVNRGEGTAAETLELVREIRRRVEDRFGVLLHPEPSFVGFPGDPLAPGGDG